MIFAQRLQNVILMNEFVNIRDDEHSNFEIDRFLKLFNNNLKTFQRKRFYFSNNNDELLRNWIFNSLYFLKIKRIMKIVFEKFSFSKHFTKWITKNVENMIRNFVYNSLIQHQNDRGFFFNFLINFYIEKFKILTQNISKYNSQFLFENESVDLKNSNLTKNKFDFV